MNMEKQNIKREIYERTWFSKQKNEENIASLSDSILLSAYQNLTKKTEEGVIWTDALQTALYDHEIVVIEPSETPYYIDSTVKIPSNRHIEAEGAIIRLTKDCTLLMLRNEHTKDGTHLPIDSSDKDINISIHGGRWEESHRERGGYGKSGRYMPFMDKDEKRPFYGVSTCMLFNNMEGLSLSDMTFAHTAGFAVQAGNIENAVFENILFESCYADGLHINGGSKNLWFSHIVGEVGDDLVALNAYDWQNSSVNFGAIENVYCEDLRLAETSRYKALRLEPGIYRYDDGSTVDCGLFDIIIKGVRGIRTFKMYLQTPPYALDEEPEWGKIGSADNIFFEDIIIDLCAPIDLFDVYKSSDPIRGSFAAFELGAKIGYLSFEDIDLILYREQYPYSYIACIGPKSVLHKGLREIFDPYISSRAETLEFENIRVNGKTPKDPRAFIREIVFDNVNGDGRSSARGEIGNMIFNSVTVK